MSEVSVGVHDLKTRLSEYLRKVKAGHTIVITEHGQPVGRIIPAVQSLDDRLEAMAQANLLAWNGKKLSPMRPVARVHGKRTVADLLIENRK